MLLLVPLKPSAHINTKFKLGHYQKPVSAVKRPAPRRRG